MIFEEIASALSIQESSLDKVRFFEAGRLASRFPVTPLAAASVAVAGLAISDLVGEVGSAPSVSVDSRLAFPFSRKAGKLRLPGTILPVIIGQGMAGLSCIQTPHIIKLRLWRFWGVHHIRRRWPMLYNIETEASLKMQ